MEIKQIKQKVKLSSNEYSENYYKNKSKYEKKPTYTKAFNIDELFEIIGEWIYDKSNRFFEESK